jgi:hypothetical protein
MLQNDQAVAYAHLMSAIEDWNGLLNTLYDGILPEEKPMLDSMDGHLTKLVGLLEP